MGKEKTVQVNWRLPESLVADLKAVIAQTGETQTDIVREGIRQKIERKRRQLDRRACAE